MKYAPEIIFFIPILLLIMCSVLAYFHGKRVENFRWRKNSDTTKYIKYKKYYFKVIYKGINPKSLWEEK